MEPKRLDGWRSYYLKSTLFNKSFFGKWNRVLWMDAKSNIHLPISEVFFDLIDAKDKIMANPDAWPAFLGEWTYGKLFLRKCNEPLHNELGKKIDLKSSDYYQSGLLLFDTAILTENTLHELLHAYHEYGGISSGDQMIFSYYWRWMRNLIEPLPYRVKHTFQTPYDFEKRIPSAPYVVTAWRQD